MTLHKLFSHKKHGLAVLMALVAGGLFSLTGCTPPAGTISEEIRITETLDGGIQRNQTAHIITGLATIRLLRKIRESLHFQVVLNLGC